MSLASSSDGRLFSISPISDVSQLLQFRLTMTRIAILFPYISISLSILVVWYRLLKLRGDGGIPRPLDTHTHTEGKAEKASITASVRHCRDHYLVVAVEYPEAHVDDHLLTSFPPQLALFLFCRGCCYVDILVIIPFFSAFIVTLVPVFIYYYSDTQCTHNLQDANWSAESFGLYSLHPENRR
jgi:hypothetical protein